MTKVVAPPKKTPVADPLKGLVVDTVSIYQNMVLPAAGSTNAAQVGLSSRTESGLLVSNFNISFQGSDYDVLMEEIRKMGKATVDNPAKDRFDDAILRAVNAIGKFPTDFVAPV